MQDPCSAAFLLMVWRHNKSILLFAHQLHGATAHAHTDASTEPRRFAGRGLRGIVEACREKPCRPGRDGTDMVPHLVDLVGHLTQHLGVPALEAQAQGLGAVYNCIYIQLPRKLKLCGPAHLRLTALLT